MEEEKASASLDSLISGSTIGSPSFKKWLLRETVRPDPITQHYFISISSPRKLRNVHVAVYPASTVTDLSAVDAAVKAMELQVQAIKDRIRDETLAIPKAKKLIDASLNQERKLKDMSIYATTHLPERMSIINLDTNRCLFPESSQQNTGSGTFKLEEDPAPPPKEKKGRSSLPLWFVSGEELDSLSSYMRGRLTLVKVNAAINDMATYAEANYQLIAAPKKNVAGDRWEKALEIRDISMNEAVKGKHFFLETDMKGPSLKLDNTGKAILTVLRHL